jgi:predicted transcriptional regulator
MRTMTILIERDSKTALKRAGEGFKRAWKSGRYQGETLSFESPSALFRVITPVRWTLIERLQALGPSSLRGLARALERDVKSVHRDVAALLAEGLVEKDEAGKVLVPFARIRAEFDMKAAA